MLYQIFSFVLDVAAGLVCGACLLRIYMQSQRIAFANPVGRLVFAFSDWLVLPLRRMVPLSGRWDWASLLAAAFVELAQYVLLWLVLWLWQGVNAGLQWLPMLALFGMARVAVSGAIGLLIVFTVLSWVQTYSPMFDVVARLCEPLLRPVRRVVPLVGGVDLSPLVLLMLLQIAMMVLGHLQAALLFR